MSRPGYWITKDKREMPISEMTGAHLHNSLRLMAKKYNENLSEPTDLPAIARVKENRRQYSMDKLVELAADAQRRGNILPVGDITEQELLAIVGGWSPMRDTGTTPPAPGRIVIKANPAVESYLTADNASTIASLPPKRLGVYLNVIQEVEQVIGLPVAGLQEDEQTRSRLITFNL